MKIAVASSGLGHVARGIETWAEATASAVAEFGARNAELGIEVTLFAAGPTPGLEAVVLPCLKRSSWQARLLARLMPAFAWRWGLKATYDIEQLTFWLHLRPHLKRGGFDILHVQDPMLAFWCHRERTAGRLKTKEILGHGTEEPIGFLEQFEYVQHLTPWHMEQVNAERGTRNAERTDLSRRDAEVQRTAGQQDGANADCGIGRVRIAAAGKLRAPSSEFRAEQAARVCAKPHWVAIPNFVDMEVFDGRPSTSLRDSVKRAEGRSRTRERLGIPQDAFVAIAVGALKKKHKRIDHLVNEMAMLVQGSKSFKVVESGPVAEDVYLILAGAREDETEEIERLAKEKLGDQCRILADQPRSSMPDLYAAADVFVHASLFEMMPIAFLEAMASGLPVICHNHPNLNWMVGIDGPHAGGVSVDMAKEGALARFLVGITPEWIEEHGRNARAYAEKMFSKDAVIGRYIEYYHEVMAAPE